MADDIKKQIVEAEKAAAEAEALLKSLLKLYKMDGVIDEIEKKSLASTMDAVSNLKAQAMALREKAGGDSLVCEPIDSSTPSPTAKATGKPFTDSTHLNAFRDSIDGWARDCQHTITAALAYMIKQETPSGLDGNDAKDLVMLVIPESKVIGAADKIIPIIVKSFKASIKAKKPTVNEIHKAWDECMKAVKAADKKEAFAAFLVEWKSKNGIASDELNDSAGKFNDACANFRKTNLPSESDIQKAFVIELVKNVEDGWDWDSESGFIEVFFAYNTNEMDMSKDRKAYYLKTCHINDASDQLHQSLKTVFKGLNLLDLPLKIKVEIGSGGRGLADMLVGSLEFERTNTTPGNTKFKLTSGNQKSMDNFLKSGWVDRLKVSDLK